MGDYDRGGDGCYYENYNYHYLGLCHGVTKVHFDIPIRIKSNKKNKYLLTQGFLHAMVLQIKHFIFDFAKFQSKSKLILSNTVYT